MSNDEQISSTISIWVTNCRNVLISMESKNITARARSWTEIVNQQTLRLNNLLQIPNNNNKPSILPYNCLVSDPLKYLQFLSEWNGIKTRNTLTAPKNYDDFVAKAKNWLNGRRAPNYGNTLFPDMISTANDYANNLSLLLFGDNNNNMPSNSDSIAVIYKKCLLFSYLMRLCSARIAVHQNWKKTNLLCENSVKNVHSNTAKLLQEFAIHDYIKPDLNEFPGSLNKAAQFFQEQHQAYFSKLMNRYQSLKMQENNASAPSIMSGKSTINLSSNMILDDNNINNNNEYITLTRSMYDHMIARLDQLETSQSNMSAKLHDIQSNQKRIEQHPYPMPTGRNDSHYRHHTHPPMRNISRHSNYSVSSNVPNQLNIRHPQLHIQQQQMRSNNNNNNNNIYQSTQHTHQSRRSIDMNTHQRYVQQHAPIPMPMPMSMPMAMKTLLPVPLPLPIINNQNLAVKIDDNDSKNDDDDDDDQDRKLNKINDNYVSYSQTIETYSNPNNTSNESVFMNSNNMAFNDGCYDTFQSMNASNDSTMNTSDITINSTPNTFCSTNDNNTAASTSNYQYLCNSNSPFPSTANSDTMMDLEFADGFTYSYLVENPSFCDV